MLASIRLNCCQVLGLLTQFLSKKGYCTYIYCNSFLEPELREEVLSSFDQKFKLVRQFMCKSIYSIIHPVSADFGSPYGKNETVISLLQFFRF